VPVLAVRQQHSQLLSCMHKMLLNMLVSKDLVSLAVEFWIHSIGVDHVILHNMLNI